MIPTWIKNISYAFAAIAGLNHDAVLAFAILMLIDVITGIFASARVEGWRKITSSRLGFGILAKLLFFLIPLSIALAGKSIGQDLSSIVSSSVFVLALSELYSVIGNIYTVKHGVRVREFDAISIILKSIKNFLFAALKDSAK